MVRGREGAGGSMCFNDAGSHLAAPASSAQSEGREVESLRTGPWVFSCPRLRVHHFPAPLGTWGCLMHIPACLLWRQAQQADRAKLRQCVCSQSGALALLSQTQVKIFNDAQQWFAVEITPGSHPPASWCVCVLGVCFGG